MKSVLSALLFLFLFSFSGVYAQDQQMSEADQMKAWQDYMTPGEYHKAMEAFVGDWTFKMKMWMDPAGEPQIYEGTAKYEMVLGGRYLQSTQKGEMMGMPFEGHYIQGYDNIKKEYTAIWYDNFGTGMLVSKGSYDPVKKAFTVVGTSVDPMTGKDVTSKQVDYEVDKNSRHMDYFMIENGKEIKSMEIDYFRK